MFWYQPNKLVLTASMPAIILVMVFMIRSGVSPYPTALLGILLLGIMIACMVSVSRRIRRREETIANLLKAIIAGDAAMQGNHQDDEPLYADIMKSINQLSGRLGRQHVADREREILLAKIIDRIDTAVITIDDDHYITMANPAAMRLIGAHLGKQVLGNTLARLGLQALATSTEKRVMELNLSERRGNFYVYSDDFLEGGNRRRLIFITDVQRILHEEERKAWQSLLRVLSHEINNTLTPIASISDTGMRLVKRGLDNPESLLDGLSVIKERAKSLGAFIDRYKQFSRLPKPDKQSIEAEALFQKMAALFPHRTIELDIQKDLVLYADPHQLEQMLVNLLKNADEAMPNPKGRITIVAYRRKDHAEISIDDQGKGLANEENLFVPFYTTKEHGSGIGLVLCRQIAFNHGGEIILMNKEKEEWGETGVLVRVILGVQP